MKSIRSHAFRLGVSSLVAAGASLLAVSASADSVPSPSAKCETTLECSSGQSPLKATSRAPLDTTVDTGWIPSCSGGVDHCNSNPVQVRAHVALDAPSDATMNVYDIEMQKGAILDVTWPDKANFTLKANSGARTDGKLTIAHTLTPSVSLYVGISIVGPLKFTQTFDFAANDLINQIPGANFNYLAQNTANFAPWAFDGGSVVVTGKDLADSELFSTSIDNLPGVNQVIEGTLALSATTSPTFTYKTTKVSIVGMASPLAATGAAGTLKMQNLDALDVVADVEGTLSLKGTMTVLPNVNITQVTAFGHTLSGLNLTIPIDVGLDYDYTNEQVPIVVKFPRTTIHVPLPNLAVPGEEVDFGGVKTGTKAQKTVKLNNSGELGVIATVDSDNAAFTIDASQFQMAQKSGHDLVINFAPTQDGDASATITVKSNDPDSPAQTFKVTGSASPQAAPGGVGGNDGPPEQAPKTGDSSGCGCHTTPSNSSTAGGTLLGLAVAAFIRRRRTTRK
jgi:MYXO-CTERM domain-containing protein